MLSGYTLRAARAYMCAVDGGGWPTVTALLLVYVVMAYEVMAHSDSTSTAAAGSGCVDGARVHSVG